MTSGDYATITQDGNATVVNGNSIVVVLLAADFQRWGAYQGILLGNAVTVSTAASNGHSIWSFRFTSLTTAKVTLVSCTATVLLACRFVDGSQFTASKVF
ncbi:MAG: hypothetical protein HOF66_03125 [Nitrosomonadaceae bacterium]|nr:hypothetical protein [Nitrosomonadaceae bacterium]